MTTPAGRVTAQVVLRRADANPHYKRAIMSAQYDRATRLRAKAMDPCRTSTGPTAAGAE